MHRLFVCLFKSGFLLTHANAHTNLQEHCLNRLPPLAFAGPKSNQHNTNWPLIFVLSSLNIKKYTHVFFPVVLQPSYTLHFFILFFDFHASNVHSRLSFTIFVHSGFHSIRKRRKYFHSMVLVRTPQHIDHCRILNTIGSGECVWRETLRF